MSEKKNVPLVLTKLAPGDKVIDARKRVEVTATDKHPYMRKGAKTKVAPAVAEKGKQLGYFEPDKKPVDKPAL